MAVASQRAFPSETRPSQHRGRTLGVLTWLASTSANTRPHYLCGCYGKDVNCIPLPAKLSAVFVLFFFFLFFPYNGRGDTSKLPVLKSGGQILRSDSHSNNRLHCYYGDIFFSLKVFSRYTSYSFTIQSYWCW